MPIPFVFPTLAVLGWYAGKRNPTDEDAVITAPGVAAWMPLVRELAPAELAPEFLVRWIAVESGGNPCAIGSATAHGPDGNPREMGLAQLYNPDDLNALGATGAELRAYCKPGTQQLSRELTDAEQRRQVALTVALALRCRAHAVADLAKVGAIWTGTDLDALTKLQHGLPGISHSGIPAVTKRLGRPPGGWAELEAELAHVTLDAGTEKYRAEFSRIFANARRTAGI